VYKVTLSFLLIIILLFSFTGCQKSRVQNLQQRLDAFRNTLPQNLRAEFDSKNYENVVKGIDSLLQVDEEFKKYFAKMKAEEAIDVFTPQEVVDFFKTYFVEEIEKVKTR
jgi:type I restriction-modification system DNA methylase subunit